MQSHHNIMLVLFQDIGNVLLSLSLIGHIIIAQILALSPLLGLRSRALDMKCFLH